MPKIWSLRFTAVERAIAQAMAFPVRFIRARHGQGSYTATLSQSVP
jgi:hypothetical protein